MSHGTPDRARQLELRFVRDTELTCQLNDAHGRLKRAHDRRAALEETRLLLLDFLIATDEAAIWEAGDELPLAAPGRRWRCHRRSA